MCALLACALARDALACSRAWLALAIAALAALARLLLAALALLLLTRLALRSLAFGTWTMWANVDEAEALCVADGGARYVAGVGFLVLMPKKSDATRAETTALRRSVQRYCITFSRVSMYMTSGTCLLYTSPSPRDRG